MLRGLVTAFRTLTIFPVPGRETSDHSNALPFFPLVGLALGLLVWVTSLVNRWIGDSGWPTGVAALMLIASIVCTGSLHLDGLADLADAVGGGWDRDRRLAIMKDSRLGVFGVAAIVLTLLLKWLAFSRLITADSSIWVILIFMIARAMQVKLAAKLPYARGEAGTAISFVKDATGRQRAKASFICLTAALVYGPIGLLLLAVAEIIIAVYGTWCRKQLGGITGDLLGAGNEITEVVLLFAAALMGNQLSAYTGWSWVFH